MWKNGIPFIDLAEGIFVAAMGGIIAWIYVNRYNGIGGHTNETSQ